MHDSTDKKAYSDKEIIEGLLNNNGKIIEYFFYKRYTKLLLYISYAVFDNKVNTNELISELFLYLAKDNWHKVRQFAFKSSLTTWLSVVATRYFIKKRNELIEKESSEILLDKQKEEMESVGNKELIMDVRDALTRMTNERYRFVVQELDLRGSTQEEVAAVLGTTLSNLYNIHHRALLQLRALLIRKDSLYDR